MRNWRVITAIGTVVLAVLAGVLVYRYTSNADKRAQDRVKQVSVLVAREEIPAGTSGSEAQAAGMIGVDQIPAKNVPANAITSQVGETAIKDLVAAATLPKGIVISTDLFVGKTELTGTLQSQLKPGDQAISFSVDQPHGVANMIQVGDSINILVSIDVTSYDSLHNPHRHKVTAFLLPGLSVIGVGTQPASPQASTVAAQNTTTTANSNTPQNRGLLTVKVNARQAEQIAHAQAMSGQIYVTLNAPGFDPKTFQIPAEIVDTRNLFDQRLAELEKAIADDNAAVGH